MEADLYKSLKDNSVQCHLCHHRCTIAPGKRGICGVRENRAGMLHTLVYGRVIAQHIDPIEKKPLYHVAPGSRSYSIATVGCNFKCRFCQNADIAQMPADRSGMILGDRRAPEDVVSQALESRCQSIAYTYTEPTVYFEFAVKTARLARTRGLLNVLVTNGYMTAEAIDMAADCIDAANVDLKAFSDRFYKRYCGARLAPVTATLKRMKARGIWVEVTTLLIPGLNDDHKELESLTRFIAEELGRDTPWHVSRFHPAYRLQDKSPTPVRDLALAREIGWNAGLEYVYIGNVAMEKGAATICSTCGNVVIDRSGFTVRKNMTANGRCGFCSGRIHGIGLSS